MKKWLWFPTMILGIAIMWCIALVGCVAPARAQAAPEIEHRQMPNGDTCYFSLNAEGLIGTLSCTKGDK